MGYSYYSVVSRESFHFPPGCNGTVSRIHLQKSTAFLRIRNNTLDLTKPSKPFSQFLFCNAMCDTADKQRPTQYANSIRFKRIIPFNDTRLKLLRIGT